MRRIAGRGGLPGTYPPDGPVIQTDRLCAAGTGQQDKDRGQAPPEPTGTVQRGNQNVRGYLYLRHHMPILPR